MRFTTFITLVTTLLFLLVFFYVLFFLWKRFFNRNVNVRGSFIVDFRLTEKTFRLHNAFAGSANFPLIRSKSLYSLRHKWVSVAILFKALPNEKINQQLRATLRSLEAKANSTTGFVTKWQFKNYTYRFKVHFLRTEVNLATAHFTWQLLTSRKKTVLLKTINLKNIKEKYFANNVVFAVPFSKELSPFDKYHLVHHVKRHTFYYPHLHYAYKQGIFYILVTSRFTFLRNILQRRLTTCLPRVNLVLGYGRTPLGVGLASESNLRLNAYVIKDLQNKAAFAAYTKNTLPQNLVPAPLKSKNALAIKFKKSPTNEQYQAFLGATNTFNATVRSHQLIPATLPLLDVNTQKKVGVYAWPQTVLKGGVLSPTGFAWHHQKLQDLQAENFLVAAVKTYPEKTFVEINDYWFLKRYKLLQNPRYTYVIVLTDVQYFGCNAFLTALNYVRQNTTVRLGFKLVHLFFVDMCFLQRCAPVVLVVATSLAKAAHTGSVFGRLLLLSHTLEHNNTKIVYVNPSPHLDLIQRQILKMQHAVFTPGHLPRFTSFVKKRKQSPPLPYS